MTEVISFVAESLAEIGIDIIKNRTQELVDKKKLQESLTEYIINQRKYNEICVTAEEIDFQGLVEYIRSSLLDDINIRVFSPHSEERKAAKEKIISQAVIYSKANTEEAKQRIRNLISSCIDIIRGFYKNQFILKDYILASEMVDAVNENTNNGIKEILKRFDSIQTSAGSLYTLEPFARNASSNLDITNYEIKKLFDRMSVDHPLFPDYGYTWDDDTLVSRPRTAEADKKYPPSIKMQGRIKIGERYLNNLTINPIRYAYNHQIGLTFEVNNAKSFLGSVEDPAQYEASKWIGKTIHYEPPKFPPAQQCQIKVDDQVFFEIQLRKQEILDDGTIIYGNKEQSNSNLYFELAINPACVNREKDSYRTVCQSNFKVNCKNANNHDLLQYALFMEALKAKKDIHVFSIESDSDLIAGRMHDFNLETSFPSFDDEIEFLQNICCVEDYFNCEMNIKRGIAEQEIEMVREIAELIRNDEVQTTWYRAEFKGIIDNSFREKLKAITEETFTISYVGSSTINLFGTEIAVRFMRTYKSARMINVDKIRQISELLDDGDEITIVFEAGDDNTSINTLRIPEISNLLRIEKS